MDSNVFGELIPCQDLQEPANVLADLFAPISDNNADTHKKVNCLVVMGTAVSGVRTPCQDPQDIVCLLLKTWEPPFAQQRMRNVGWKKKAKRAAVQDIIVYGPPICLEPLEAVNPWPKNFVRLIMKTVVFLLKVKKNAVQATNASGLKTSLVPLANAKKLSARLPFVPLTTKDVEFQLKVNKNVVKVSIVILLHT
jgi:hypothetical protein